MSKGGGHKTRWTLTVLVIAAFAALILAVQFLNTDLTVLADTYRDTWEVIPILLGAYLLKACTVVIVPQPLVYLLTGLMFSPLIAFLLTIVFLSLEFTADYAVGTRFGKRRIDKLFRWIKGKNKFLDKVLDDRYLDRFSSIALLRLMPGISTDSVSLLAGAKGLHFGRFFLGSMVGCMPQAVTVTLMGSAATDPLSPSFLIPLAALVIILVATLLMKKLVAAKRKDPSADE